MTKQIPLSGKKGQGKFALVDDKDYEVLAQYKWHLSNGYAVRRGNKPTSMHRAIMQPPSDLQVDHINGDRLDNRRCNLRLCTGGQNKRNRHALVANKTGANQRRTPGKTSQYKGVANAREGKRRWRAAIGYQSKTLNLGYFMTEIEAAKAYDAKAKELYGEFANPNFK